MKSAGASAVEVDLPARVGLLTKRGRLTVVDPFFERGRRMAVDLRGRRDLQLGELVLLRPVRGRARQEPVGWRAARGGGARWGRPGCGVHLSLLYERGHHRRFAQAVEARRAASRAPDEHPRRGHDGNPDVHDRPAHGEGLRRRAVSGARRRGLRLRVHGQRGRLASCRAVCSTPRPSGAGQAHTSGGRGADAAARAVLGSLQPDARRRAPGSDRRGGPRSGRAAAGRLVLPAA